jgi:hypothetical protein
MSPGQWVDYHVFNKPPGARMALPIGQSILGFIVWLLGFLLWRAIRPATAVARVRG